MKSLLVLALSFILACPARAHSDLEEHGSPRERAPDNWTKFEWPKMKAVLFGQYAPTEEELELIDRAVPKKPTAKPAKERRILVFYRCLYPHTAIATACETFERIGASTGAYTAVISDNPADFTSENLKSFDAVLLNNTVNYDKIIGEKGKQAILDFVRSGKGLIGIHAASDAAKDWKEGAEMMGGIFGGHPWLPNGNWAFQLETPDHPINAGFKGKGFWLRDEIYSYRSGTFSRSRSRVLVGLDLSRDENRNSPELHKDQRNVAQNAKEHPVSWIHQFGGGRVFYTSFGHRNTVYWNAPVLQHMLDGIQFALGDLEGSTTPSADLEDVEIAPAPEK